MSYLTHKIITYDTVWTVAYSEFLLQLIVWVCVWVSIGSRNVL